MATCITGIVATENMYAGGAAASLRSGRSAAEGISRIPTSQEYGCSDQQQEKVQGGRLCPRQHRP